MAVAQVPSLAWELLHAEGVAKNKGIGGLGHSVMKEADRVSVIIS